MLLHRRLIESYIIAATLPYFGLSLLLLTCALLAQQSMKFTEILGNSAVPLASLKLLVEITLGLLPNVLIFTLPMSVLIGTATGFSQLGGDSELTAIRSAGTGTWRIISPVLLAGVAMTAITLYVGMELAPSAARSLRRAALRGIINKLESPVDPRTFNLEMPDKVIYVREGDSVNGEWQRVFINWHQPDGSVRIITARSGRIDSSEEQSELVLNDVVSTIIPAKSDDKNVQNGQYQMERSERLRVRDDRLNVGRNAIFRQLGTQDNEPTEMNWREMLKKLQGNSRGGDAVNKVSAALHKRLSLCFAPLVFALLGSALGINARRGGRGLGVLLALSAMIIYYLVALACEQFARAGYIQPSLSAWLANIIAVAGSLGLLLFKNKHLLSLLQSQVMSRNLESYLALRQPIRVGSRIAVSGYLDRSVLRSLSLNFVAACAALVSIFIIFTLFELIRFMAAKNVGVGLVGRYLMYLAPMIVVTLSPLAMLVAVLITYALMARRSEAIAWLACGQSLYRLALPGIICAGCVGLGTWLVQEKVLPETNRRQDALRAQIRGGGAAKAITQIGRQWMATGNSRHIFSYNYNGVWPHLAEPWVYEFDEEDIHLRRIVRGSRAKLLPDRGMEIYEAEVINMGLGMSIATQFRQLEVITHGQPSDSFKPVLNTPSHLNIKQLSSYISSLKARGESVNFLSLALEKKRADPFGVLVLTILGIPLGTAFGRRSAVTALFIAVLAGVCFWGISSGFQHLGSNGVLPPKVAAWAPMSIFCAAGFYLLFHCRT